MPFSLTISQKQAILWVGLFVLLMVFLYLLGPIMTPFIAGAILAYLLNPAVERLSLLRIGKFAIPRFLAVITVMLVVISSITILLILVVPIVHQELPLLYNRIPDMLVKINHVIAPLLHKLHVDIKLDPISVKQMAVEQFAASRAWLWKSIVSSARVGGTVVVGWLVTLILTPVVLFYLLLDWRNLLRFLINAVPRRWAKKTLGMAVEIDELLGQYLRGQFLVMLILAAYYAILLGIIGLDVALPVGILTGFLVFIPYVGFGIGFVLALFASLLQFDGFQGFLYVLLIYAGGQALEGVYLTPKLVGGRIGLHPLMVIFALFAFGKFFGFVGVLLALPMAAISSVAYRHLRANYLKSKFYTT